MDFSDGNYRHTNQQQQNYDSNSKRPRLDGPVSASEAYANTHNWVNGGSWHHDAAIAAAAGGSGSNNSYHLPPPLGELHGNNINMYGHNAVTRPMEHILENGNGSSFKNPFNYNNKNSIPSDPQGRARWIAGHGQK